MDEIIDEINKKNSIETISNPFEGNESIFLSTDNRKEQRKKGKQKKVQDR